MARTPSAPPQIAQSTLTTNANNTTANAPIFHITGAVEITRLFGVVVTDLSSNHTAAALRINDQTAQVYLTAIGGTTLSAIKAGSVVAKSGLVATAITKLDNAVGVIGEPATTETTYFTPVVVVKKTGAVTDIEYRYTTTNAPATGAIQFFCEWRPLSADGAVVGV